MRQLRLASSLAPLLILCAAALVAAEPGTKTLQLLTERKYGDLEAHLGGLHAQGRLAGRWTTALEVELEGLVAQADDPRRLVRYANEWARKLPRSAWPFILRAEITMAQAWRERRRSREPKGKVDWLGSARRDLEYAQRVRPPVALVLARRITILTATEGAGFEARALLRQAETIDPADIRAALAYAEYLLPQWHGSSREALDFAGEFAGDRREPARAYVALWVHAQLADETYLERESRRKAIERCVRTLDSNFPNATETHVAAAEIYRAASRWGPYGEALKAAAKLGHSESMRTLALAYSLGQRGFPKDADAAREWRERLARAGDTAAMVDLGWQLARGEGVAKDLKRGFTWLERAARGGSAAGHAALGQVYAFGELGKPQDLPLARRHLEQARKLGAASASYHLGLLLNRGAFGERDPEAATGLLIEAGEAGWPQAWLYLGQCYESQSAKNAAHYYRRAIEESRDDDPSATAASAALLLLLREHPELREEGDPREVIDPTRR